MQKKWIKLSEESKEHVVRIAEVIEDSEKEQLVKFQTNPKVDAHDKKLVDQFKKKQMLSISTIKSYKIEKGPSFSVKRKAQETDLTVDMLRTGSWKEAEFKKYNFQALG